MITSARELIVGGPSRLSTTGPAGTLREKLAKIASTYVALWIFALFIELMNGLTTWYTLDKIGGSLVAFLTIPWVLGDFNCLARTTIEAEDRGEKRYDEILNWILWACYAIGNTATTAWSMYYLAKTQGHLPANMWPVVGIGCGIVMLFIRFGLIRYLFRSGESFLFDRGSISERRLANFNKISLILLVVSAFLLEVFNITTNLNVLSDWFGSTGGWGVTIIIGILDLLGLVRLVTPEEKLQDETEAVRIMFALWIFAAIVGAVFTGLVVWNGISSRSFITGPGNIVFMACAAALLVIVVRAMTMHYTLEVGQVVFFGQASGTLPIVKKIVGPPARRARPVARSAIRPAARPGQLVLNRLEPGQSHRPAPGLSGLTPTRPVISATSRSDDQPVKPGDEFGEEPSEEPVG